MNDFLKWVQDNIGLNKKTCVCIYQENEHCKPHFDFDIKDHNNLYFDINKRNEYLKDIIVFMNNVFIKCDIVYSENHRLSNKYDKEGKIRETFYKYSFQVIINNYYSNLSELKNFVNNISDLVNYVINNINKNDNFNYSEYSEIKNINNLFLFTGSQFDASIHDNKLRIGCWVKYESLKLKNESYLNIIQDNWPVLSNPGSIDKYVLCNITDDALEFEYDNYDIPHYNENKRNRENKKINNDSNRIIKNNKKL